MLTFLLDNGANLHTKNEEVRNECVNLSMKSNTKNASLILRQCDLQLQASFCSPCMCLRRVLLTYMSML